MKGDTGRATGVMPFTRGTAAMWRAGAARGAQKPAVPNRLPSIAAMSAVSVLCVLLLVMDAENQQREWQHHDNVHLLFVGRADTS